MLGGGTLRCCAQVGEDGVGLPDEAAAGGWADGVAVEGVVAGFPFRGRYSAASNALVLAESVLRAAGAATGDTVTVELTRVGDAPEVLVPDDLRAALDGDAGAGALWAEITPMARREWVRWIASAKQQKTRERRIAVGLDKLNKGMRRPCCFPGLNFVTNGLVGPEDTWGPLPPGAE